MTRRETLKALFGGTLAGPLLAAVAEITAIAEAETLVSAGIKVFADIRCDYLHFGTLQLRAVATRATDGKKFDQVAWFDDWHGHETELFDTWIKGVHICLKRNGLKAGNEIVVPSFAA